MRLGLKLSIHNQISVAGGIDFSSLPNLPVSRQSAVTTAAIAAATDAAIELSTAVSAQDVINSLPLLYVGLPGWGCNLVAAGGAEAIQGDPVGVITTLGASKSYAQTNAASKPTSGADGLVFAGLQFLARTEPTPITSVGNWFVLAENYSAGRIYNYRDSDSDRGYINLLEDTVFGLGNSFAIISMAGNISGDLVRWQIDGALTVFRNNTLVGSAADFGDLDSDIESIGARTTNGGASFNEHATATLVALVADTEGTLTANELVYITHFIKHAFMGGSFA